MTKKQIIRKIVVLVKKSKICEPKTNELIDGLKDLAKQVLTVTDYEEVFSVKLKQD